MTYFKRILGEFFLLFSGAGGGSLGRRRNFLVTAGLLSKISGKQNSMLGHSEIQIDQGR